jgi:hypothetical protein
MMLRSRTLLIVLRRPLSMELIHRRADSCVCRGPEVKVNGRIT